MITKSGNKKYCLKVELPSTVTHFLLLCQSWHKKIDILDHRPQHHRWVHFSLCTTTRAQVVLEPSVQKIEYSAYQGSKTPIRMNSIFHLCVCTVEYFETHHFSFSNKGCFLSVALGLLRNNLETAVSKFCEIAWWCFSALEDSVKGVKNCLVF